MKTQHLFSHKGVSRLVITMLTALIGGSSFKLMHVPIPWLLGPMTAVLIGSSLWKGRYGWPGQVRNAGMIIVGYTIGLSMTAAALQEMSHQLTSMLLMTLILLLMCASMAYVVSKLARSDYLTALLGCIPGGLTQVISLAEETEGVNITVVTVMQVVRLMAIIICVPILIFSPVLGNHRTDALAAQAASSIHAEGAILFPDILPFAAVSVVCALAGDRIRFPTAYLLGPAIGTAILQMFGLHGPQLPSLVINAAQFMIGAFVGLLLKPGELTQKLRTVTLALLNSIMLVAGALGLSLLLREFHSVSMSTALLSIAPGGMDQMGIIAHEINADLSIVAGYQLFRTFFIFFAVPSLFRLIINRKN
ncbi:AbrB family transcriptional regulator [Desulfocucumis palustris]|uniref:AbrB family transcriptional regulator n=1 Tax=Desulfocucumis palustris TaxID=1898651 RepID=A0A2L2XBM4_9FIRM|nr:AbrB family transcriptional regulator [Desulfocucumis palustris]GBF33482.1 AbrB family transcriptional regulator [Desulfocucumis palustris]